MVFDPNYVTWETEAFIQHDWTEFYKDAKEQIPANAPSPRGPQCRSMPLSTRTMQGTK
jgi:hypothetical protein